MQNKIPPKTEAGEVVVRISYQSSMGASRGAVFETYLPLHADKKLFDSVLDKLRVVCDRQEAVAKVAELNSALASDRAQLEALGADMQRTADAQVDAWNKSGRKGEFKLSQAEAQHRQNLEGSIINRKKSIEFLEKELSRYGTILEG